MTPRTLFDESRLDGPFNTSAPADHLLSPCERAVYGLASRGYTGRYIAERLGLSPRTVEAHVRHIYEKTGVATRDELIEYSERNP